MLRSLAILRYFLKIVCGNDLRLSERALIARRRCQTSGSQRGQPRDTLPFTAEKRIAEHWCLTIPTVAKGRSCLVQSFPDRRLVRSNSGVVFGSLFLFLQSRLHSTFIPEYVTYATRHGAHQEDYPLHCY